MIPTHPRPRRQSGSGLILSVLWKRAAVAKSITVIEITFINQVPILILMFRPSLMISRTGTYGADNGIQGRVRSCRFSSVLPVKLALISTKVQRISGTAALDCGSLEREGVEGSMAHGDIETRADLCSGFTTGIMEDCRALYLRKVSNWYIRIVGIMYSRGLAHYMPPRGRQEPPVDKG